MNSRRIYRDWVGGGDLVSFTTTVGTTDLFIRARRDLSREAHSSAVDHRSAIESYCATHPLFATTLEPLDVDGLAPPIVRDMAAAARIAGVGPLAAVAGAIAEAVGMDLLAHSDEVIVENGGDVFIATGRRMVVGLYAGDSILTGRIGLAIEPAQTPLGVCTSSSTFGHSLSFGRADACTVLARSAALADAMATALCNQIRSADDLARVLSLSGFPAELLGVLAIVDGRVGIYGAVNLVEVPATT